MPRTDRLHYYVDLRRAGRIALLAGPFDTHTEALAMVDRAVALAHETNPYSHFDLYGTFSLPWNPWNPKGWFNAKLGI